MKKIKNLLGWRGIGKYDYYRKVKVLEVKKISDTNFSTKMTSEVDTF